MNQRDIDSLYDIEGKRFNFSLILIQKKYLEVVVL